MRKRVEKAINAAIQAAIDAGELKLDSLPQPCVERPRDPSHGDWASTVALRLAKLTAKNPREIASLIAKHIVSDQGIATVEIAGPGFINVRLSNAVLHSEIANARSLDKDFARVDLGQGKHLNIEFISANPTGPMHVGHGRWAALGIAMCNIAEHAGFKVTREFYVNDAGHQMDVFAQSIVLRYLEFCGQSFAAPDEFYGGAYITDIAKRILDEEGEVWFDTAVGDGTAVPVDEQLRLEHFRERGYKLMLNQMQELCAQLGLSFDVWFSESTLYKPSPKTGKSAIQDTLERLDSAGYLYQKDDATWFRSTTFGDDKDRVLIKADGSYTYFAPDIAYHLSKYERGADSLINIWGADHHGYVARMQAACAALGHAGKLEIVLGQLVNLFRDGEAVRMSKRTGEMITFAELIDEVGADATKYLMLARSSEQTIDFDIEVAKKQDASNPVYYVQYAHARIYSILRKANELAVSESSIDAAKLSLLSHDLELDLAREFSRLSEVIEGAARDLAPFRLTHYAEGLATKFHAFYTHCKVIGEDCELTKARLFLVDATRRVLALVLTLLGVSAPKRM